MPALAKLRNFITQSWPPKPAFTGSDVEAGSQKGRVFIVTGGNSGVGFELCKLLYRTGATVYMTSRSEDRAKQAIDAIVASVPASTNGLGHLKHLRLDLEDLQSVKDAAQTFSTQESRLDVLWNNAGVGGNTIKPTDSTKQGLDPFFAIHCIAPLLFVQLLLPQLNAAAGADGMRNPRVVWSASALIDSMAPENGLDFAALETRSLHGTAAYAMSKTGAWVLSRELARLHGSDGIISVACNPGNLNTGMYKGTPGFAVFILKKTMLHEPVLGAYSQLYAGLSPDISISNNGIYVMPWGRLRPDEAHVRSDIINATKPEQEGGLGYGAKFWGWCDDHTRAFK